MELTDKLLKLKEMLKTMAPLCVGYSGGVDSTFLLKVAHDVLGNQVFAVLADGEMLPRRELNQAIGQAEDMGVTCHVLPVAPLTVPAFLNNAPDRCYHCKKHIFSKVKEKALAEGAKFIADGQNADDANMHRPGHKAALELAVVSPLKDCGLTKADIRRLSQLLGLPTWDKPANACLATRLPYGATLTKEGLLRVETAESLLLDAGFKSIRARMHGEILRIEAEKQDFDKLLNNTTLIARLKGLDFKYITLDLEGLRSGSMD